MSIIYKSDKLLFSLSLPDTLADKIYFEDRNKGVSGVDIVHKASKSRDGLLFSIYVLDSFDFKGISQMHEAEITDKIAETDKYTYFLYQPTDVRFDDSVKDDYRNIYYEIFERTASSIVLKPNVFFDTIK